MNIQIMRASGGIGRHTALRMRRRKAWGFKSLLAHHTTEGELMTIGEHIQQRYTKNEIIQAYESLGKSRPGVIDYLNNTFHAMVVDSAIVVGADILEQRTWSEAKDAVEEAYRWYTFGRPRLQNEMIV